MPPEKNLHAENVKRMNSIFDRLAMSRLAESGLADMRCDRPAQTDRNAVTAAMWPGKVMRRSSVGLLTVLVTTVWWTPASATDPETICFAGSGKARIDIVMCTRALFPAKALTRATLLIRRARARIQVEDDLRALEDLEQALAINPLSAEALTEKGRALRFLRRPREARNSLEEALRLSPNDTRARRIRGVLALTRADHASAISDFSAVIATNPATGASHALRGIAHYFMDDPAAALQDFREAMARDVGYAYLPLWLALALQRTGRNSDQQLRQARAALLGDQDWPAPVIAMYERPGPAPLAAALDLARRGTPQLRRARAGQVHFLHGELLRLRGAPELARRAFQAAVRNGDPRTIEHALAAQRLAAQSPGYANEKTDRSKD